MRFVGLALPAGLLALALAFQPARAQEPKPPRDAIHFGAGSCAAPVCHGGRDEARAEYKVWATKDKHHRAFDVLKEAAGQRMGERLGIEPTTSRTCLVCHATTGVKLAKTHVVEDGVSCELCHGGAKEWLGPHAAPEWKDLTADAKLAKGLRDLSTPDKRVAACIRCHVGAEGSDITHAIMAAGHPPLVFDAQAFLRKMPPHWKDEQDHSVSTWVAGLKAVALARLDRIERAFKTGGGLEFSVFDCYSCHHPIYAGSVYEKTGQRAGAGALPLDLAALKVLLVADGTAAHLERFRPLYAGTFDPRDGNRRALAQQAREAAAALAKLFPSVMRDKAAATRYLGNLATHLDRIAAGKVRAPRAEMLLLAMAIQSLKNADLPPELDKALKRGTPYDAQRCAKLALGALR